MENHFKSIKINKNTNLIKMNIELRLENKQK